MKKPSLITLSNPYGSVAESYKMFRTNLNYLNICGENKVLLFTSTQSEEGKVNSIANTAISFAQSGKRVLLIDCDFRKAYLHEVFSCSQTPGLSNLLTENNSMTQVLQKVSDLQNLYLLATGTILPDPSKLWAAPEFENTIKAFKKDYDIILINTPPVLSVSDVAIISKYVDGVILIVAKKETKKDAVMQAKDVLQKVGANVLGVLMTKAEGRASSKYYNYDSKKEQKRVGIF